MRNIASVRIHKAIFINLIYVCIDIGSVINKPVNRIRDSFCSIRTIAFGKKSMDLALLSPVDGLFMPWLNSKR